MNILILGGTKFLGPFVVRELAELGHDVTIFHRGATEQDLPPSVRHIHGDFARFNEHIDNLRELSPEVVLDMAPFRAEDAERLIAFEGVARRVVAISSQDVYRAFGRFWRTEPGPPDPMPLTEDSPLRKKLSIRGLDYNKTAIERRLVETKSLNATILRLPAIHGRGDHVHRLFSFIKRMDDGRPFILLSEAAAQWQWARGYVEDMAHAIVLAVTDERAAGRIYNVAYEKTFNGLEWVQQIGRIVGWTGEVIVLPNEQLPAHLQSSTHDLTQQFEVDSSRIRKELDYTELVEFDEAMRRTIDWERKNPPAKVDPAEFNYHAEDAAVAHLETQ
ncbi:MAG TPA: NAD-dependent epimerase/dehydratase family protein [Pyrinomonadaceae bacterium]|nr:NAD-dependent epimerase/dehydratase family protein [Pyrinomonadaceae bacterium]